MKLQAVFFDMGGTIETFGYTRELRLEATKILRGQLRAAGVDLPETDLELLEMIAGGLNRYKKWSVQSLDELPPVRIWSEYIFAGDGVEQKISPEMAEDLMVFIETRYYERAMRPEIPTALEAIRQMGLKIGLISNVCSRGQVPLNLKKYGIKSYFDPIVLSSEYGRRKPDPAIFQYAAWLGRVPAGHSVYIGDRITRDIAGAQRAGFGMAVQIRHDFEHGEIDEGAQPDAVVNDMQAFVDLLAAEQKRFFAGAATQQRALRAILFDAGDILYFRPARGQQISAFLHELGLAIQPHHLADKKALEYKAYRGLMTPGQYYEALLRLYGVQDAADIARGKVVLEAESNNVTIFEGVADTLARLKADGYLLGIITDTATPLYAKLEWFERGGFGRCWDSIVSSKELGVRKPDPQIYQAAMEQLGITADQAIFVGHKTTELEGARAVGMQTVAFNYEPDAQADFYIEKFCDLRSLPPIGMGAGQPATDIEAILFDVGGTLRRTIHRDGESAKANIQQIHTMLGADSSLEDFTQTLIERARGYQHWARETRRELSEADLWAQWMLPHVSAERVRPIAGQLNQLWRDAWTEKHNLPEAPEAILGLFRRGYRLGLVSNTTSSVEAWQATQEMGVRGCFETVQLSCETGSRKPDPSMLIEAAHKLEVSPGRCVYIGDRPDRDVAAARGAGFAQVIILRDPSNPDYQTDFDAALQPDRFIDNLAELLDLFPARTAPKARVTAQAALSSMWAGKNFAHLQDFLEAARRMGFAQVELNHEINSARLAGVPLQEYSISNVHEPCPADVTTGELKQKDWLISSLDEEKRLRGVVSIQRSINLAAQIGAKNVVVHGGQMPSDLQLEKQLRALLEEGQGMSAQASSIRAAMVAERAATIEGHFRALQKSLAELLEYAAGVSVRLALENRYHYTDLPNPDEMEILLGMAGPEQLGMVFDTGHAQVLDRLGFYPFQEWLERFAPRIVVTHLHDVDCVTDHRVPGSGEVDFALLAAYLPEDALRTFEVHASQPFERLKTGLNWMISHGWVKTN